ncbi:MAG: hypothetical protein P4N60_01200 [Verrucomicrobiae bacterium]|nr:hypothetical protein [Verrucomicrobiae bacterium]
MPVGNDIGKFLQTAVFLPIKLVFLAHELRVNLRGQKISQSKFRAEPGNRRNDEPADGIVPIGVLVSTGVYWGAAARPAGASAAPPSDGPGLCRGAADGEN